LTVRKKRFVRFLSDEDAVDMELTLQAGRVTGFCLNYRVRVGTDWHEVIRYDTAHGRPHVHRFWYGAEARPWPGPRADLEACVDWADADIRARWQEYRARRRASL
jgi:hypothetical protein